MKISRLSCACLLLACGYLIVGARLSEAAGLGGKEEGGSAWLLQVDQGGTLSSTTLEELLEGNGVRRPVYSLASLQHRILFFF
uniref:Receptor-type tyrosine-protein phosphatase R n=1 Tax=Rhipicephalus appendiculatus TaxID=34631 RepID=A0A131YZZ4_RHIAP